MEAKKLQKSYFDVVGLCCSSEVLLIEKILKPMEGVKDVSVIIASRTLIVLHDNLLISQLQIGFVKNRFFPYSRAHEEQVFPLSGPVEVYSHRSETPHQLSRVRISGQLMKEHHLHSCSSPDFVI